MTVELEIEPGPFGAAIADSATVVADISDMDRADWLEVRRGGIGGSDAAAICGLDRWTSAFEVWLDKSAAPNMPDDDAGEAAFWGTKLENVVADVVAERTGLLMVRHPFMLASVRHPFMLANLDRAAFSDGDADLAPESGWGVYEGKTAGYFSGKDWADGEVPPGYVIQGQHYCRVTGLTWVIYGVLIGGQKLELRIVHRDEELIDHLITLESDFWQRVQDRTPPDPDGSKACTELLAHLYDVREGAVTTVEGSEALPLLMARSEAKAAEKAAGEAVAEAENRLKVMIGESEIATDSDTGRVLFTWKEQTATRIDSKRLKADRPDTFAAFSKTSTHRTFLVPKGGK